MLLVTNFVCGLRGGIEESVVVGFYKVTCKYRCSILIFSVSQT